MGIFKGKETSNDSYNLLIDDKLTYTGLSNNTDHSPLFNKILTLLPKESLAKTNIRDVVNSYDLVVFSKAITIMRKNGYCFLIIGKNEIGKITLSIIDNPKVSQNQNVITEIKDFQGTVLDLKYVHVLGSYFYPELFKVFKTQEDYKVIERYNELYTQAVYKYNEFAVPIYKDSLMATALTGNTNSKLALGYKEHQAQFRNNLKNKNLAVIPSDSAMEYLIPDLNSLQILFDKLYKDICMAYTIPFTKLFGESATGLNATGEGDRLNWYDQLNEFYLDVIKPFVDYYVNIVSPNQKNVVYFKQDEASLKLRAETDQIIINNAQSMVLNGFITKQQANKLLLKRGIL